MNNIPDDSFLLDECKLISDILRSRYGGRGEGLGQITNSVAHKLPISLVLSLRQLARIRNRVVKDREKFPIKVYIDKIDRKYFEKLASEVMSSLEINVKTSQIPINNRQTVTAKSKNPPKFSYSKSKKLTPEVTMSNPHYKNDLKAIDDIWDLTRITNSETIFILSGCNLVAELLDRPLAEMVRDEIDRLGNPKSFRRAIVISDFWWWQEAMSKDHPVIAIGGPVNNGLTREILEKVEARENKGLYMASVDEDFPKIAVWGENASQTRESVEKFIQNNLHSFLDECWK